MDKIEHQTVWTKSRPLSVRSNISHDVGTVEPADLDLATFLREDALGTSAAQRDEATMRAMGRRQLLDRNFGSQSISSLAHSSMLMPTKELPD